MSLLHRVASRTDASVEERGRQSIGEAGFRQGTPPVRDGPAVIV